MCVPICGRFFPNEGDIAGYVDRMRDKYAAKWGVQMAGMSFQTRSSINAKKDFRYSILFMTAYKMLDNKSLMGVSDFQNHYYSELYGFYSW